MFFTVLMGILGTDPCVAFRVNVFSIETETETVNMSIEPCVDMGADQARAVAVLHVAAS